MTGPPPEYEPVQRRSGCAAVALVVLGLLIVVPSGLCAGFFLVFGGGPPLHPTDSAVFGLLILVGLLLIVFGVWRFRQR